MEQFIEITEGCTLWIEQETVHIKAVDTHGDPIELTEAQALRLANVLMKLVKSIEASSA